MRRAAWALAVVAAAVAVGTALVYGQVRDAGPIEQVTLRSGSYADFRQVFVREAPADISVPATLRFPDRPAACLRHVGPYDHAGPTYERVLRWAATTGLLERDAVVMGLSYDDPGAVAEDALRYDVCLGLTEPVALPVGFRLETVRGGRYAVHALRGPYDGIHDAFRRLFGKWLPTSREEVDDRPCLELHLSRSTEVPESERLTKVCIPLRNEPSRRRRN